MFTFTLDGGGGGGFLAALAAFFKSFAALKKFEFKNFFPKFHSSI